MQERLVSFLYLKIFLTIFTLIILGSVAAKVIYEVVSSSFTTNSFSVLYIAKDSKIIYIDQKARRSVFIAIGDIKDKIKGKDTLSSGIILGIPIHGVIIDNNPPANTSEFSSFSNMSSIAFGNRAALKDMNRFDVYKFAAALRSIPEDNRVEKRVNILTSEGVKNVSEDFSDTVILNDSKTVEIQNGTSINGLGSDLAYIFSLQGFNVISVKTAESETTSHIAYPGEEDVFTSSVKILTGFDLEKKRLSQAADVTVFLGDDIEAMLLP